jgi:TRAP-type transport system periplasmic protein
MRDQFITSAIPQTKSLAERLGATFSATRPPAVPPEKFTITLASARDGADTQIWSQGMTHFYDVKAWIPQDLVLIRKDSFNSLNDSEKKAVTDAAQAAETRGWEMAKAEDTAAIKILQDNHIVVEGANGALGGELKTLGQTIAGERQQELEALGLVWPPRPAPAQP